MSDFLKGPWWEEAIRGLFALPTMGASEVIGRDNQLGRTVTGGGEGAVGGFLTGGPIGAIMGAGTGAGLSGTGTTDPYSLKGGAINFGSGGGAGGLTSLPGLFAGGSGAAESAGGVSGMSPYMPTSAPDMGAAGSTLGAGGIGSPLNLLSGGPAAAPSSTSKILQMMRLGKMFGGQQQQQQPQAPAQGPTDKLKALYTMFPGLRPGANMSQSPNFGGQYGA